MIEFGTKAFWRATIAISMASFFVFAMVYITQPILPMYTQEFGVGESVSSLSLSVVIFSMSICLLFFGPISDALGRKSIMVMTMLGAVLCTLLIPTIQNFNALILLRALQGVFLAGLPSIAMAYMSEEFSPRALVTSIGIYISANSLGGMSGRIVSGIMADLWGWRMAFIVIGIASALFWITFALVLPNSSRFQPKPLQWKQAFGFMKVHLKDLFMRNAFIIGGLNFFVFVGTFNFITFRLSDSPYYLPPSLLGLLFLTYLGGTFSSMLSGQLASRHGIVTVMLIGISLFGAGLLLTLHTTLWFIVTGIVIQCIGFFLTHSACAGWVSSHASFARASATGLYLSSYYLGGSLGSLYLGLWWYIFNWNGVVIGSFIIFFVMIWCSFQLRQKENSVQSNQP